MNKFSRLLIAVVLIAAVVAGVFGPASVGSPSEASAAVMTSSKVAMIPNYYNGSVGAFPISGTVYGTSLSFNQFTFTDLALVNLNLANLSAFDTAVLNQNFTNNLTAQQKADLNSWVDAGGKLIIYDSDTTSGNEYSWLIRPFTTNASCPNCGMVSGSLAVVEENTLSSANPASPYYIDTTALATQTDAVGDANVFLTQDPNWFGDMLATNGLGRTGWTHAYAETPSGKGLIIYNGLDIDYISNGGYNTAGIDWLAKIWYYELAQQWDPSGLPGTTPVSGSILLSPLNATLDTGQSHTVVARVSDTSGWPLFGAVVNFTVTGVNSASGAVTTDTQGHASFSYVGQHGGRDTIVASATLGGMNVVSNDVHIDWVSVNPKITIVQPIGGNEWALGWDETIKWTSSGFTGNVNIYLSRDAGTTWKTIASRTPNDGWQVFHVVGPPTNIARIKIASVNDPTIFDTSSSNFLIVNPATQTVWSPIHEKWVLTQSFANYLGEYPLGSGIFYNGYHSAEDWAFQGPISGAGVFSIAQGTVVKISPLPGLGNMIVIEHTGSFNIPAPKLGATYHYPIEVVTKIYSVYMHVDPIQGIGNGTSVGKGQLIAKLANISHPHLHFEIRTSDQRPSNDWSLLHSPDWSPGKPETNWQTFPNGDNNGYYKDVQVMVDSGFRNPSDFINANQ